MFPPSGDAKKRQNVCCAYASSGASFRVSRDSRLKIRYFKDSISAIVQLLVVNSVQCIITNIMKEKAYSSQSPPTTSSSPAPATKQNPHNMQPVLKSSSQHKHRFSQVASVQNRQTVRSQDQGREPRAQSRCSKTCTHPGRKLRIGLSNKLRIGLVVSKS